MAYIGTMEALRGCPLPNQRPHEERPGDLATLLRLMKGKGSCRNDHQPIFKYNAFVVKGKGPKERKDQWDIVKDSSAYTGRTTCPP